MKMKPGINSHRILPEEVSNQVRYSVSTRKKDPAIGLYKDYYTLILRIGNNLVAKLQWNQQDRLSYSPWGVYSDVILVKKDLKGCKMRLEGFSQKHFVTVSFSWKAYEPQQDQRSVQEAHYDLHHDGILIFL